jgi:hypothetical protein
VFVGVFDGIVGIFVGVIVTKGVAIMDEIGVTEIFLVQANRNNPRDRNNSKIGII